MEKIKIYYNLYSILESGLLWDCNEADVEIKENKNFDTIEEIKEYVKKKDFSSEFQKGYSKIANVEKIEECIIGGKKFVNLDKEYFTLNFELACLDG